MIFIKKKSSNKIYIIIIYLIDFYLNIVIQIRIDAEFETKTFDFFSKFIVIKLSIYVFSFSLCANK
jgi:hypothetical protein